MNEDDGQAATGLPVDNNPMQQFRIRDGVGFCQVGTRTIVLDIDGDRYWQMDRHAGDVLQRVKKQEPLDYEDVRSADLIRRRFVEERASGTWIDRRSFSESFDPEPVEVSALEAGGAAVGLRPALLVEIALLLAATRISVRFGSLRSNLERSLPARCRDAVATEPSLPELARIFHRHRRLLFFASACLPDTLAFLRFAARRGHLAAIVFGVEAYPFAAHCWAQSAEHVLTDTIDQVRAFTPIYALRCARRS